MQTVLISSLYDHNNVQIWVPEEWSRHTKYSENKDERTQRSNWEGTPEKYGVQTESQNIFTP
jgi:hypothetical protein